MPRSFLLLFPLLVALLLFCNREEPLSEGECGNGILNKGEECDEGIANSDLIPDSCRGSCLLPTCGDGIKDSDEECDTYQLDQMNCSLLGFDRGELSCGEECTFDTTGCSRCLDGVVEGEEECEPSDFQGMTCMSFGFASGTLACYSNCTFDLSGCRGGCGNGLVEEGEQCDIIAEGTTCAQEGFAGGALGCNDDCTFDFSSCEVGCGNGVVDPGEVCDDGNPYPGDGCYNCRAPSGQFASHLVLDLPYTPTDLAVRDLDGDDLPDLLVSMVSRDFTEGALILYRSSNGYTTPTYLASGPMIKVAVCREGGNTLPSLVGVSLTHDSSALYHLFNDLHDTGFTQPYPARARDLLCGDLDGAPGEELYLTSWPTHLLLRLELSSGLFTTLVPLGGEPGDLAILDFNGDQVPDLLTVRPSSQMLSLVQGLGQGEFVYQSARYVGGRPTELAVGDLNGDGKEDLLVTDVTSPSLYLLRGSESGLSGAYLIELPTAAEKVVVASLSNDNVLDLVLSFPATGSVVVFTANGEFSWEPSQVLSGCNVPIALEATDFDGDGFTDLVYACTQERQLHVQLALLN